MQNALVPDHHVIRGSTADINYRNRLGDTCLVQGYTIVFLLDDIVVPGSQRLGDDPVESNGGGQSIRQWLHRRIQALAFAGYGFQPLLAVATVKRADWHAGNGVYGLTREPRLLQGMLNDGSIQPRPGVPLEMRGCAVNRAYRVHGALGFVFEDLLLGTVNPGPIRATDANPRRDHDQATVRQGQLGVRIAIIEANRERAELIAEELKRTVVLNGSSLEQDILREAGVQQADVFVALTNDDKVNVLSSLLAMFTVPPIAV